MKIKAIVFDWGGVIGLPYHDDACKVFAEYSSMSADEIYDAVFKSGIEKDFDEGWITPEEFYLRVCRAIGVSREEMTIEQCKEAWQKVIVGEDFDIFFVLTYIHSTVKLYLLSNTNIWHWEIMSRLERVNQYFNEAEQQILSFNFGFRKPSKMIYREAIKRAGCRPDEMIYVDDILEFAEVFGSLGGQFINYNCKKQLRDELGHAIWKIDPDCLVGKHGFSRKPETKLTSKEIEKIARKSAEYWRISNLGK